MRKRIYLNLVPVTIAWTIVLLHSFIPHNHSDEELYSQVIHHGEVTVIKESVSHGFVLNIHKEDHHKDNECHFSPNLFHESLSFTFFIGAVEDHTRFEVPSINIANTDLNNLCHSANKLLSDIILRAPPVVSS